MLSFPNCKINLGLRILDKREDGYHNLVSVFYPVKWCDALEIIVADDFSFVSEGLKVDGMAEHNLCVKAYRLFQKEFSLPPVKMMLLKNIPMGAGLGGGSADGAFTLKMLNELFKLELSTDQLKSYALQLGSDCPFFIENKPMLVTGKGELMENAAVDLSEYFIELIYPDIAISTEWAFRELAKTEHKKSAPDAIDSLKGLLRQPLSNWKKELVNDFEQSVAGFYPEVSTIKKQLYAAGAVYASMSGSGSSVFGIFEENPKEIPFIRNFQRFSGKL